jgi:hypothetical protein
MNPIRSTRVRQAVALGLLASLGVGLASPALAARASGATSIYSRWLGERLGTRADRHTDHVIGRMAESGFPTLRDYVVTFVRDLVADQGLGEAARILRIEAPSSIAELTFAFLKGLSSLSSDSLPEAVLLESGTRALPVDRSVAVVRVTTGRMAERLPLKALPGAPADDISRDDAPGFPVARPRAP